MLHAPTSGEKGIFPAAMLPDTDFENIPIDLYRFRHLPLSFYTLHLSRHLMCPLCLIFQSARNPVDYEVSSGCFLTLMNPTRQKINTVEQSTDQVELESMASRGKTCRAPFIPKKLVLYTAPPPKKIGSCELSPLWGMEGRERGHR